MPLRKHFAFRKNGRVHINQSAYAALQQEGNRLQNKKNMEREKAIIAASAERRNQERNREREQAQLLALTEFLQVQGVRNPTGLIAPLPRPQPAIPPAVNIMRGLPPSFRAGIPLLLTRLRDLGEVVPVAVFHSRKHARLSKSKLRAVASFGGNPPPQPRVRAVGTPTGTFTARYVNMTPLAPFAVDEL